MNKIKAATFSFVLLMATSVITKGQGTWSSIASFGGGSITEARAFSIGNFGYIGAATQVLWQYDPAVDVWTQMASMPGAARPRAAGFSIGTKGYFGTGGALNDFYEYDQSTNSWMQKANFGGAAREGALGIAISGKGYIGTGGSYFNDWWEYDPATDTWTQKANLAGPGRYHGGAFAIDDKGYVCTGFNGSFFNDLWEYDPISNAWTAKASLPATTRDRPVGAAAGGKGYIVTGWTGTAPLNDAWEYDPVADAWTALPAFPGAACYNACGFGIGSNIYVGTGNPGTATMFKYGPSCTVQTTAVPATCTTNCDGTASVINPSPTAQYLWSNGSTTSSISALCPGVYTVTVTDSTGCTSSTIATITNPGAISGTGTGTPPSCFGLADGQACFTPSGGQPPYSFMWAIGDTSSCITNIPAGLYSVTITDVFGCSGVNSVTVSQPSQISVNTSVVNATCQTCTDGSAFAAVNGGTPSYTYLWSTGATMSFISNLAPGVYTCCVTDMNGCSTCDSTIVSYPSGISDPEAISFSATPNPFSSDITLTIADATKLPVTVKVIDVSGKVISSFQMDKSSLVINTEKLAPAMYFLEISGKNLNGNLRMTKAR